ncbi:MAG: 3-phosphoshikimate 1-carboxyvinyltransferase [Firmicutes bacterium]|nr:3-phosphoshikimate 1-carboxyvinyltransferase [Bacillota bacterium]
MDVKITPSKLSGQIEAIASKSEAHRLLICAALSRTETELNINKRSDDIDATIGCLRALGAEITVSGSKVLVKPCRPSGTPLIDAKESGSTLRFMIPVAAALAESVSFTGGGRLPERPIGELLTSISENGSTADSDRIPLTLSGKLKAGTFSIPGNVSSQYITGLLLALPLLEGRSSVKLTSKLESKAYVDITLDVMKRFGVEFEYVENEEGLSEFVLDNGNGYSAPPFVKVDGDWSNGAFFLVAGALGNGITVSGLSLSSPQGDKEIISILRKFGADVMISEDVITVLPGNLKGTVIDINETPDLLPILSVLASFAEGETEFVNGARLRIKESDRLMSSAAMINGLGGCAEELPSGLKVQGFPGGNLRGGNVDSFHDHRIAMSAAIAATRCDGDVYIKDAGSAAKSYPDFYSDYRNLGGKVDVI